MVTKGHIEVLRVSGPYVLGEQVSLRERKTCLGDMTSLAHHRFLIRCVASARSLAYSHSHRTLLPTTTTIARPCVRRRSEKSSVTGAPIPISLMDSTSAEYVFPTNRLRTKMIYSDKVPVVLVACGSFSPVTYLHLRMFEMAQDYVRQNTDFEIVGGISVL